MFDKFGEFNSVEELNEAAAGFKNEGDTESLYQLAEENGLEREDAEDYLEGMTEELASLSMAAYGKLELEEKETAKKDLSERMAVGVILAMTRTMLDDNEMQKAILKKGKRISGVLEGMKNGAKKHKNGNMGVSCGTDKQLKDIIRAYYTLDQAGFESEIEKLYA